MRSIFRILFVGLFWAAVDASMLVASVVVLGNAAVGGEPSSLVSGLNLFFTPYVVWLLPSIPVGSFFMTVAFGSGFALSNIEETIKALPLATFLSVLSGLLTVYFFSIPFSGISTGQQGYAQAAFFGTVALPLFLLGLVGGVLGTTSGSLVKAFLKSEPW